MEQIRQFFQDNNIKQVELKGEDLLITYNDGKKETYSLSNNQELKPIKSYLQSQGKSKITFEELTELIQNKSEKKNYWPWIIGRGVILAGIIGLVIWLVMRKKKGGEKG
ncbi:hypothetical protein [endosymbiont GvMRE of Glomus versiforme]|uniref:hypothetical protein n=1 Tax=endosymbiont GvMRE of Glomus versiforme TaxID=2039283 RepID=UPI0011C39E49|nr:hypothetical protein [endosymbiont GvMRE of Glomus versiforme]